jgi:hypothetical protein
MAGNRPGPQCLRLRKLADFGRALDAAGWAGFATCFQVFPGIYGGWFRKMAAASRFSNFAAAFSQKDRPMHSDVAAETVKTLPEGLPYIGNSNFP